MSGVGERFVVHHYRRKSAARGGMSEFERTFESVAALLSYLASERYQFVELRAVDEGDCVVAQTLWGSFTWPPELVKLQTDFSEEEILDRFKKAVADEEVLRRLAMAARAHEVPRREDDEKHQDE